MIMADILKIFLLVVGLLTVYVSYWLVAQALFPGLVERARQHYGKPVKITLLGLAAAVLPFILGVMISKLPNPVFKIAGVTLMVARLKSGLRHRFDEGGVTAVIGPARFHPTVRAAVAACGAEDRGPEA